MWAAGPGAILDAGWTSDALHSGSQRDVVTGMSGGMTMPENVRKRVLEELGTVVVKVGTGVLSTGKGTLDRRRVASLADQIHRVKCTGRHVVLVTSGAIGAGMGQLRWAQRPKDLPRLQAAASVGQSWLIRAYDESFRAHGYHTGQILVTRQDFDDRTRYLNIRNAIRALVDSDAIPVINENDTVSVDELRFGDNDIIAAMVTHLLRAGLLVLLSTVDGLCATDADGKATGPVVKVIQDFDEDVRRWATSEISPGGSGGMASKLEAARMVCDAGEAVIIAGGRRRNVLVDIIDGKPVGTLCLPRPRAMTSRKRWIGFTARPRGKIAVDVGARQAIQRGGKSLLAIGITGVSGRFGKGDVVSVCGPDGVEFARGLCNYTAEDVDRIKGLRTGQFAKVLGDTSYDEVIHRDNLALVDARPPSPPR